MPEFLHRYLKRYAYAAEQITQAPNPKLGLIVVIPCHFEPDIITTLDSLLHCQQPHCHVEIIVVLNACQQANTSIIARNKQSHLAIKMWSEQQAKISVHVLEFNALSKKHAGVGMARKLGMDEAIRRFAHINQTKGMIISLDADCTVDPTYLMVIDQFRQKKHAKTCVIPFKHQTQSLDHQHIQAINMYELDILYHLQGLKAAHYPHCFHTLGSCFAVSAQAYAAQGGMNRRQAGEDFYFLHKMAELGDVETLKNCCVYPSARLSLRVPFGTGQALQTWIQGERTTRLVVHPTVYQDLATLFLQLDHLYHEAITLAPRLEHFLLKKGFTNTVIDMRNRVTNPQSFQKRFLRWFNALRIRQYINDCGCNTPLDKASTILLAQQHITAETSIEGLLQQYRQLHWHT